MACLVSSEEQYLKLYHGTSNENAISILQEGFAVSDTGQLGIGVYLAREDKAERFAVDSGLRGHGTSGTVLQCQFAFSYPKYVNTPAQAGDWISVFF